MANDELMRLAAKWRAENGDYPESKRDCADELERALAQRAPLHGAVPEEVNEWAGERKKHMRGDYAYAAGWNACRAAMLAAAPAPDQYPDAGKMVGESLDGLPINDAVPAPTEIRPGNLFLWNWRAMQQYGRACIAHAASASAPEAERAKGWRCFHCSEEFTDRDAAALHFGTHEYQEPACLIDIVKFREMEALQRRYLDEDADVHRAMRRMETEHQQALRRAEEDGYAKGLADAVKYPDDCTAPAGQPEAWRTIMAAELSERALETMAELGNFGPTVNVQDRQMKGYTLDSDGEVSKTYLSATDMRRIAADLLEAADWLDARASAQRAGKEGA